jgi:hypothetical protein
LTVQDGVPVWTCVPDGAFASLNVAEYVPGATLAEAAEAVRSNADSARAAIAHIRFMSLVLLT